MKRGALVVFLFAIAGAPFWIAANFAGPKESAVVLEKPLGLFPKGEKLRYDVSWMGVHIGYGEIEVLGEEVVNGRDCWHVVAVARTNEVLSKLYPVKDTAHSWVDVKTLQSLKFRKTLSEGRYRADEEVEFFPEKGKGKYRSYKSGSEKEFEVPPNGVHDILSAFYWFRLQDVSPGRSAKTVVNSEEKNWDLEVKALGLERKEIRGLGSVGTLRVEPKTRLKGILYDRGRAWVYFTSDASRRPVWFKIETPYGAVNAVLSPKTSSPAL